jgi:hypothetical protein
VRRVRPSGILKCVAGVFRERFFYPPREAEMKKKPKKLHLTMETVKALELSTAVVGGDISGDCQETLKNIVCKTMPYA